uniref:Uncharacterized protein n=1 Tax=Anguilla anguilla TaxID=7936 RepID=A0A0E9US65_ANGAN
MCCICKFSVVFPRSVHLYLSKNLPELCGGQ